MIDVSFLATFNGIHPDYESEIGYNPCETGLSDIRNALDRAGVRFEISDAGEETDYSYLAGESDNARDTAVWQERKAHWSILGKKGGTYAKDWNRWLDESPHYGGRQSRFWNAWRMWESQITISEILTIQQWESLRNDIGFWTTDTPTLGTLGGPLSDGFPTVVSDIHCEMKSQIVIASIRCTPFPCNQSGEPIANPRSELIERFWEAFIDRYGSDSDYYRFSNGSRRNNYDPHSRKRDELFAS